MASKTKADQLLEKAYDKLGLKSCGVSDKYSAINDIVDFLNEENEALKSSGKKPIHEKTTGTISERLCELGLKHVKEQRDHFSYQLFEDGWKWVGDFLISGHPFDLTISVKSFKARERFLASGSGSLLAPTIGWGIFDDPDEWTFRRVENYLYRGFVAIYMPSRLLSTLDRSTRNIMNTNGNKFLRGLDKFTNDLTVAVNPKTGCIDFRSL